MRISDSNRPGGWRHFGYSPRHPWGDDTFVQWGESSSGGFFVEAYPPGTYIARRGATLEEAEDRAWTQHQREIACSGHRWSMRWHAQLGDHPAPRYLVVQDGMGEDLPLDGLAGLFVGGSTEWKRSTMRGWARVAARHGLALHVGRVNSARLIREVLAIGAESGCPVSCDGTSATLYASTAPALGQAAAGAPQLLLGLT